MFVRTVGADLPAFMRPAWAPEGTEQGNQPQAGDATAEKVVDPNANNGGVEGDQGVAFDAEKTFAELEPATREWLQKSNLDKDPKALAKKAHEQEKLLGGTIKLPGKDATPEEREAFLNKLGRPEKPEEYAFTAPKDMPEGLPYDGEKASEYKGLAHKLGLTKEQAAGLHDWFVGGQVDTYKGMAEAQRAAMTEKAETETGKLVKLWGDLKGETALANFEIADKVFQMAPGGQEVLEELKAIGLVGPGKEILSAPLAKLFASIGTALYTEDGVLRGRVDEVGNPFDDKTENLTEQMQILKNDPDRARSLITAAGKKPSDFGTLR